MTVATIHERSSERYRQSVDIKKYAIAELSYILALLSPDNATTMTDAETLQMENIRNSIQACVAEIEELKA